MKLQTVWTKAVVVIYLVTIIGACLYVPSYMGIPLAGGSQRHEFAYRWVWDLDASQLGYGLLVDYGRVALEVVSLTATAGVLLLIGSLVSGRKRGKQSDPVNRE